MVGSGRELRVLIAGGGTGGHLYPALSIAQALKGKIPCEIRFIGSRYGLETKALPFRNEILYALNIRGVQRGWSISAVGNNLLFPLRFLFAYLRCRAIFKEFKPQVVVGTGGYASGVPLILAQRSFIPTLIQEQNSYPGITTRKLAGKAAVVCLTYEESTRYIEAANWEITGNPILVPPLLPSLKEARKRLDLPQEKVIVFILGGSQGSQPLNAHFRANWRTYTDQMGVHLLWQTGSREYQTIADELGNKPGITLVAFIEDIHTAYLSADLAVSRAGAMTLSELTYFGKPSILIPFPQAAADHQTKNAQILVKHGAAVLIRQLDLSAGFLESTLEQLIKDPKRLEVMSKKADKLSKPGAAGRVADRIIALAQA